MQSAIQKKNFRIGVFGGSKCTKQEYQVGYLVGKLLAERGSIIYCGGLTGIMEAVSKGGSENGGIVVGILPGKECDDSNKFVSIPIATGAGVARNVFLSNSIHGAIAIRGKYGTLSEIAHTLQQKKPIVGINTWDIDGIIPANGPEEAVEIIYKQLS